MVVRVHVRPTLPVAATHAAEQRVRRHEWRITRGHGARHVDDALPVALEHGGIDHASGRVIADANTARVAGHEVEQDEADDGATGARLHGEFCLTERSRCRATEMEQHLVCVHLPPESWAVGSDLLNASDELVDAAAGSKGTHVRTR